MWTANRTKKDKNATEFYKKYVNTLNSYNRQYKTNGLILIYT